MCEAGPEGPPGPLGPRWASSLTDQQAWFVNYFGRGQNWLPIDYNKLRGPEKRIANALIRKTVLENISGRLYWQ